MFYEKIDLYKTYSMKRPEHGAGTLTVYCREQRGDLFRKLRPAMLVIPGGGYEYCSDREEEPVALEFLHAGYCVFVLGYTVKTAYPTPLAEAAMAMRYIREHAEKYGVDPAHVGAIGFSAGGHLAGMLALLYGEEPVKAVSGGTCVRPDALLLTYPVITGGEFAHTGSMDRITGGDVALREQLSLEKRVTKNCPPVFLWHAAEDDFVPAENSLLFAAALRRAGVPFELHLFEKGWHGTSVSTIETERSEEQVRPIAHLRAWLPLAFSWLKLRGFCVRPL